MVEICIIITVWDRKLDIKYCDSNERARFKSALGNQDYQFSCNLVWICLKGRICELFGKRTIIFYVEQFIQNRVQFGDVILDYAFGKLGMNYFSDFLFVFLENEFLSYVIFFFLCFFWIYNHPNCTEIYNMFFIVSFYEILDDDLHFLWFLVSNVRKLKTS